MLTNTSRAKSLLQMATVMMCGAIFGACSADAGATANSTTSADSGGVAAAAPTPTGPLTCNGTESGEQESPALKMRPNRAGMIMLNGGHMLIIPDSAFTNAQYVIFAKDANSLKFNIITTAAPKPSTFTIVAILKGCGVSDKDLYATLDDGTKLPGGSGDATDNTKLNVAIVAQVPYTAVVKARGDKKPGAESGWVTIGD